MTEFRTAFQDLIRSGIAPEWQITLGAIGLLAVALIVLCYTTQLGNIARATTKEAIRQPVFFLLLGIGLVLLVVNFYLPFFSLGEDIKMLKDCGLAVILFCGMFLGIWTSSTSIAEEIEGKTAMTLLSKPINRRQFIVGKFVGIFCSVLWLMLPLMLMFAFLVYCKPAYDAREGAGEVTAADQLAAVIQILPGMVLIFLEVTIMTAVSVAISTRLPMVVNIVTCMTIFVIGHLTPVLVRTVFERLEPVKFMAQIIATVLPSLEAFNTQAVVATGQIIPPDYLGFAALYCAVYCSAALLLAFILFEDRDLA